VLDRCPRLSLSVASIHRPADYEAVVADVEIRFGPGDGSATASRVLPEILSPVCAPDLLAEAPDGDWRRLPVLAMTGPREGWSKWCARAGCPPMASPVLRFDSFVTALAATRAGAGVLLASLPLIAADLESGAVARLSPVSLEMPEGHWIAWRDRAGVGPDLAALCEAIVDFGRTGAALARSPATP